MAIKVLELCHVSPSEVAAHEQLLSLLNFDIVRLGNNLLNFLFFYSFPCSESHFLDTIVPNLKNSLSLTLKHFLPLSGKIIFPLTSGMPVSRYVAGEDAVSLTIGLSRSDFYHLIGNHSRDADEFHDFVPLTLSPTSCADSIKFSGLAIQVTLFPNQGICIGQTIHHAMADGTSSLDFQRAWALIHKFKSDTCLEKILPFYERSVAEDVNLAKRAWNHKKTSRPTVYSTISLPTNAVRAKFVLSDGDIRKLKNFALIKKPTMPHISSTVVVSGLLWSCFTKSAAAAGEEVADDESEYLTCSANCRARLSPPLPHTYFGNCAVLVLVESTHQKLKGNEGFVAAANAIAEALHKFFNKNENTFDDLEIRIKLKGKRVLTVAGSPRFDYYGVDYGWGRPKFFEYLTNDCDGSVFLCKSRGGGIEIGLSMPKVKMDAFAAFFYQGLEEATGSKHAQKLQRQETNIWHITNKNINQEFTNI